MTVSDISLAVACVAFGMALASLSVTVFRS